MSYLAGQIHFYVHLSLESLDNKKHFTGGVSYYREILAFNDQGNKSHLVFSSVAYGSLRGYHGPAWTCFHQAGGV